MSKTYRPYDPEQQLLLPAALQEWLPADHMAYFISDVVEELDLSVIMARYEGEERGGPPYHPRMLVKVLLYGYCIGVASSRRNCQAPPRGHCVPGAGGEQHAGTSAPSPTFARTTCQPWPTCFYRCWSCVRRRVW